MSERKVIVVVSTALPPAPSGQAMVLQRLLRDRPERDFVFFSDNPATWAIRRSEGYGTYVRLAAPTPPLIARPFPGPLGELNQVLAHNRTVQGRAAEIAMHLKGRAVEAIIGCSGNPHDLPASALAAKSIGVPFVAYLFDDPILQWPAGEMRRLAVRYEPEWAPAAAATICPNEVLARDFERRTGRASYIVRNPVSDDGLIDATLADAAIGDPVNIVYTGSVYSAQADAFLKLREAMAAMRGEFVLHIYTAQSVTTLQDEGIHGPDVLWHEHRDPEDISEVQRNADILYLPLAFASPIQEAVMSSAPGKLADYLAAGRPILVHAPAGSFLSQFFRKSGAGCVVDDPVVGVLCQALAALSEGADLRAELGRKARVTSREFSAARARSAFWSIIARLGTAR
jgi:hypothetical protein